MQQHKKSFIFLAGILALMITGKVLLGADFPAFLRWYLVILAVGLGFYPLTSAMFSGFSDRGWVFAKTIGIALSGFVVWLLGCIGVMSFTNAKCIIVTLILIGVCWGIFTIRKETTLPDIDLIILEEMLLLGVFLMWTYFTCFNPNATGTEKFMDYGFMAAMDRNPVMPTKDIWYGTDIINYYYGGQYYGVFIEKLCFVPVKQAYNLYRMTIAAFAFVLPFSIVWQMVADRFAQAKRSSFGAATIGGILAGAGLSMAGNVHYVVYKLFGAFLKLEGWADYWFPDSTRYIGYNPVNEKDQCIHEFPSYSFVLGDVHAHMINIMFVLTVVGLLYAYVQRMKKMEPKNVGWKEFFLDLLNPYFVFCGFFIGLFHWTNFWDFIIYFTVTFFTVIYAAWYRYFRTDRKKAVTYAICESVLVFAVNLLAALPFTLQFKAMVSGIGIAKHHTLPHQMLILWGLPIAVWIVLLIVLVRWFKKAKVEVPKPDIFAAILGLCGFGLILIPELVYVRDIYEEGYARSNTMFKLTYQGFILFALMMGYTFVRVLAHLEKDEEAEFTEKSTGKRQKGVMTPLEIYAIRVITGILLVMVLNAMSDFPGVVKALLGLLLSGVYLLIWFMFEPKISDRMKDKDGRKTVGIRAVSAMLVLLFGMTLAYMPYSVDTWFGLKNNKNIGIDCTQFLESDYAGDAEAIRWLDENVKGQPICLEANGDSYSEYERVSAMTGIPTVAGWYVHEWLWRNDTDELNVRNADIETVYTSGNEEDVRGIIEKYDIAYIFVGSCEETKYGDNMDKEFLKSIGEVVFENETSFIVQVKK